MKTTASGLFALALAAAGSAWAQGTQPPPATRFSIDSASPSIGGSISADDVLRPGPLADVDGARLGLGLFDNLDALSFGQDPIRNPLRFSVDRLSVGLPGSAVNARAQPGVESAATDVYRTLPPTGSNVLAIPGGDLGLLSGFLGDDLDGLELDSRPAPYTYFSIDALSGTNGFGTLDLANDILVSRGDDSFSIYATGEQMGLLSGDDIDALVLIDFADGTLDERADGGIDLALFSLSPFSPSTFTSGLGGVLSPADILLTDFSNTYSLWASAEMLGLRLDDNVDGLDTIPEPGTIWLLSAALLGLAARLVLARFPLFSPCRTRQSRRVGDGLARP